MSKGSRFVRESNEFDIIGFKRHDSNISQHRNINFNRLKAGSGVCYLDNAGASLYSEGQVRHYASLLCTQTYGNPHSGNQSSKLSSDTVEQVRTRVLQFFNTNPDKYSVIFTSGATASLKLLAESFTFVLNNKQSEDAKFTVNPPTPDTAIAAAAYDNILTEGTCVDTGLPWLPDNELSQHCNIKTCKCDFSSIQSHGRDIGAHGVFYYMEDNHTSVVGMRKLIEHRGYSAKCIQHDHLQEWNNNGLNDTTWCSYNLNSQQECCLTNQNSRYISVVNNNLVAYPAQSNFNGQKYSLDWISALQTGKLMCNCDKNNESKHTVSQTTLNDYSSHNCCHNNWFVALDAASFVSTSPLDLSLYSPDFVVLSFYKIFGFPTGLGCLIVKNSSAHVLQRNYFGGGTVNVSITRDNFQVLRGDLSDRFEDGTISFLDIIALNCGFDSLQQVAGSMTEINHHTFHLARLVYTEMVAMQHNNGAPVIRLYHGNDFDDITKQGPIISFNVLRSDGSFVGYNQVDKLAQADDIHIRTGCFCNMGACQIYLGLSSEKIKDNFKAGHVCGDDLDLIEGQPTGSCRISFGYYSTLKDALTFLNFISNCFQGQTARTKQYLIKGEEIVKEYFEKFTQTNGSFLNDGIDLNKNNKFLHGKDIHIESHGSGSDVNEGLLKKERDCEGRDLKKSSQSSVNTKNELTLGKQIKSVDSVTHVSNDGESLDSQEKLPNKGSVQVISREETENCLTNIFLYPVKSCGAFEVSEWEIGPRGLLYDRHWMIVTSTGVCLNQKREPRLCTIKPTIDLVNRLMVLSADGYGEVSVSLDQGSDDMDHVEGRLCSSKVCGDRVHGSDCGDNVADWLQTVLNKPGLRLVRQSPQHGRINKKANKGSDDKTLSLANEAQYLLINRRSCQVLLECSQSEDSSDIDTLEDVVSRFRANLVVSAPNAFEEDHWKEIHIGGNRFVSERPCTRCQMICIDQITGEKSKQPLLALTQIRHKKTTFGILISHESGSESGSASHEPCSQSGSVIREPCSQSGSITKISVGDNLKILQQENKTI